MAKLISASLDLSKIDKSKIIEGKNGAKYYNITISVNDKPNEYGQDTSITQAQTKEERESKTPKVYLGNGKTFWSSEPQAEKQPEQKSISETDEQLPF